MDEAQFLKALGKHLRKVRKSRKISTREMELRGEVSRHILSEIENGKRDFRITTLKKILNALNISEREFWEDFKSQKALSLDDLMLENINKIIQLSPNHNDTVQFRKILQEFADQLKDFSSNIQLSRFLLIQRMELHDCLNQDGLSQAQEKSFLKIKKLILERLDKVRFGLKNN